MADLISREAALDLLRYYPIKNPEPTDVIPAVLETARKFIAKLPDVDAVSRGLFEQIKWERDIAMEQLTEHGIAFGAKSDPASLRPKVEWISVEDRLPKDWEDVLVLLQCGDCIVAARSGKYWRERWCHSMLDRPPTHWMPLPEPPNTEVAHDS